MTLAREFALSAAGRTPMWGCKKESMNWIFTYKDYPDYRFKNEVMLEDVFNLYLDFVVYVIIT